MRVILFCVWTVAVAIVFKLSGDTTQQPPLRGTNIVHFPDGTFIDKSVHPSQRYKLFNSIPKQTNFPPEGKNNYRGSQPPPLPTNTLARLRWVDGDIYTLDWEEGDEILTAVKPILKQSKSGKWRIIYPQAP